VSLQDNQAELIELLGDLQVAEQPVGMHQSAFLKGLAGSGKTHFLLSAPGPIVILSQDTNRTTLQQAQAKRGDIYEVNVSPSNPRFGSYASAWKAFESDFMPKVTNRRFPAATIGIDSLDSLQDIFLYKLKPNQADLDWDDWATALSTFRRITRELTEATRPRGRTGEPDYHPGYHVIVTSHLRDVSDAKGNLVKTVSACRGQLADKVEDNFDQVLVCDSTVRKVEVEGKPGTFEPVKECFAWTVEPTRYHTCKAPLWWPPKIYNYGEYAELVEQSVKREIKATVESTG
jgi:hypothetical protein